MKLVSNKTNFATSKKLSERSKKLSERGNLEMDESHDAVVQPHVHAHTFTRTLVHGVEMVPHLNITGFKNGSTPKHNRI